MSSKQKRIVLAMTGASGAPYFLRLLERLRNRAELDLHLVVSEGGRRVMQEEADLKWSDLDQAGLTVHAHKNYGASIASGSFKVDGMVIVPCSMNTVGAIAAGLGDNLILRAAAVQLKEGRPLIVVPRETPFSLIHLRTLTTLKESGAVIMPAAPGFYHQPKTITDLVDSIVDRIIDQLGLEDEEVKRWDP